MTIYVVRHAKAGKRSEWHDDDNLRPLSKTSPAARYVQTLEPLAKFTKLKVEVDKRPIEFVDVAKIFEVV